MDRRSLLKTLALASFAGIGQKAFNMPLPQPANQPMLNLVLHGLFVMQFADDGIQLMTPYVSLHQYLASSWDLGDLNPMCPGSQPIALQGVKKGAPFNLTDQQHQLGRGLILSMSRQNFTVDTEYAYLTVSLPWPQDIKLLRFAKPDPIAGKDNIFKNPPLNTVKELSLCQVLTYPIDRLGTLKLAGTAWRPKPLSPQNTINLHLWAEPDRVHVLPSHAIEAYQRLGQLLPGLSFELATTDVSADIDSDPGVKGMTKDEEKGLGQWKNRGEGSSGSNCGLVMVTR